MIKVSTFLAESEFGLAAVPLFGPADAVFEKTASAGLLPEVLRYIELLRPRKNAQYVLVNAMGAGEYYGPNINADHFPEAALIHKPDDWTGNPLLDKSKAKNWPYGFPTFYNAHAYSHHRNKDPSRAYGDVEFAAWNDHMKRVELVIRIDKDKCQLYGGVAVWDKCKAGMFPDVSMGCLPAGSLVTMADGTQKPIELVRETDWVLSHTGARRRVTDTMHRSHEGSIFRLNVYGFRRELVLTGNHPLWLVDGDRLRCDPTPSNVNKGRKQRHCTPLVKAESKGCAGCSAVPSYEFEWRRTDEAQVGDYLAFPVPQEVNDTIRSKYLARFLGYYLAEGHVSNYNNRPLEQINFSLGYEEGALAREIERLARRLGAEVMWHYEQPEQGARYFSVVSKELADKCLRWCGSGAPTKVLSSEVQYMQMPLLLEFLGAYLDGDGGTYKGSAYFSTASETLSHQLFIALARCGIIASVNKNEHKPSERSVVKKETTEYQVWIGTDFSWKLGLYTKKPVRRSKKVRGQRFFYEKDGVVFLMAPILEIVEEDYKDAVYNFSVEEEESYVAEGLAVHNSKVPYDTCSITLDWDTYKRALATFNPRVHKHPGMAVLEFHKKLKRKNGKGIRGVSVTRNDYDEYMRLMPNRILPDGRKVFVFNDFPRFFDISFVFIGADKTAKVMIFIKRAGFMQAVPSALTAEKMGLRDFDIPGEKTAVSKAWVDRMVRSGAGKASVDRLDDFGMRMSELANRAHRAASGIGTKKLPSGDVIDAPLVRDSPALRALAKKRSEVAGHADELAFRLALKKASVEDHILKAAFLKRATEKQGEIEKEIVPSQFAGKAIPVLNKNEPDIPDEMLKALSTVPVKNALATTSGLGMLLRPREFERTLMLRAMRQKAHEAEDYENLSPDDFMPALARILMPMMSQRSALAPYIERRIVIISERPKTEVPGASSLSPDLLRKMGAAYNGYRRGVMNVVPSSHNLIESASLAGEVEMRKLANAEVGELFTPLTVQYLDEAFIDELSSPLDTAEAMVKSSSQASASVERGLPLRNT